MQAATPPPTDFPPQYFDEMAALELRHPWTRSMRTLMLSVIRRELRARSVSVLDLGCGTGLFLADLAAAVPIRFAVGMDLHAEALAYARRHPVAHWVLGSAVAPPFGPGCFDLVHSSDVLQHLSLEQTERTLERCREVLRPGGLLALRVRGEAVLSKSQPQDFSHAFSRRSLRLALASRDFRIVFLSHANTLPSLWTEIRGRLPGTATSSQTGAVHGISLAPEQTARHRLLSAYLRLERSWLSRTRVPLPLGHTILCVARRSEA